MDYPITSLFFAQGKTKKLKMYKHKTIKTRSLKKYTADKFCDKLNDVNFANYSEFDVNHAFVDLSDKLFQAVDWIAPYREFRGKGHTEDWFDGEIMERIKNRDKLLKKYKKSKLEVDHKIYREAKLIASTLIKNRKINHFKQKFFENTGN